MSKKPKKKQPLTPKQLGAFEFINGFIKKESRPPSTNEIADALETTKGNASRYTSELVEKGWLTRDQTKTFSIEIVP